MGEFEKLLAIYPHRGNEFSIGDAFIVSGIAIAVVFVILIIIVIVCAGFQKGIEKVECLTNINPKPENKLIEEDEDALASVIAATIDFYKETGKDARLVSIEKLED